MNDSLTPALRARRLIRACDRASLATSLTTSGADGGWPYASLVMAACGPDAAPLLLMSDLAEHSRNLVKDDRASLLFDDTSGLDSPLTGARVTVLGRLRKTEDEALLARYIAHHPDAEDYVSFADFYLYRMEVERSHLVAGFGEIHWFDGAETTLAAENLGDLPGAEGVVVDHMNADHADAVRLYATSLLGLPDGEWVMTGIDPEGMDMRLGGQVARLDFEERIDGPGGARAVLVELVDKARSAAGQSL